MAGGDQSGGEPPGTGHMASGGDDGHGDLPERTLTAHGVESFDPAQPDAENSRNVPRDSVVDTSVLHETMDNLVISSPEAHDAYSSFRAGERHHPEEYGAQPGDSAYTFSQQQQQQSYASPSWTSYHQQSGHPNTGFFPPNNQTQQLSGYGFPGQDHSSQQPGWSDHGVQAYSGYGNQPFASPSVESPYSVAADQSTSAYNSDGTPALYGNDASNNRGSRNSRNSRRSSFSVTASQSGSRRSQRGSDGHNRDLQSLGSAQEFSPIPEDMMQAADLLYDQSLQRQGQGVYDLPNSSTAQVIGPSTSGPADHTNQQEIMQPLWEVYKSKEFWPGRVFITEWSEPMGTTVGTTVASASFFHKKRRFVIAASGTGHSICLPISSYTGQGCKKRGVKKEQHGIIYCPPSRPVELHGEGDLGFQPIQMTPYGEYVYLRPSSRVNYAKPQSIEHNVPVYFIGEIHRNQVRHIGRNMHSAMQAHDRSWYTLYAGR